MKGVGDNEHNRSYVNKEDDTQSGYLQTSFNMTEVDRLVPVQGYPYQAQARDVDTASLKNPNIRIVGLLIMTKKNYLKEGEKVTEALPKDPCALECCVWGDGDCRDAHYDV